MTAPAYGEFSTCFTGTTGFNFRVKSDWNMTRRGGSEISQGKL